MVRPTTKASALVVDDDRAVASLLATFLGQMGMAVTVAHTQAEGEARLDDGGWALLVTDLQLGGGAGSEGLDLLARARSTCPEARTILVSGSIDPNTAQVALHHGADLFLPKPISFADFSANVRTLLGD
jgi:DNA-binding response OmpR family regulator